MIKKAISSILIISIMIVCSGTNSSTAFSQEVNSSLSYIDLSQIDNIEAYAEENDLNIGVTGTEHVIYKAESSTYSDSKKYESERAIIDNLLAKLQDGECIAYFPESGKIVIENNKPLFGITSETQYDVYSILETIGTNEFATATVTDGYYRRQITDVNSAPYCYVASVFSHWSDGDITCGTGFFIDNNTILTAGHMVYSSEHDGYTDMIEIYPGGLNSSYSGQYASSLRPSPDWLRTEHFENDYALVSTANAMVSGNFTLDFFSNSQLLDKSNYFLGFPGDKSDGEELWLSMGTITDVYDNYFISTAYSIDGNSGGPASIYTNITKPCGVICGELTINNIPQGVFICTRLTNPAINFVNTNKGA